MTWWLPSPTSSTAGFGWPWWPPTRRSAASGSCTSSWVTPASASRSWWRCRGTTPGCRPWPASPTRPAASSARCMTCTASSRATTHSLSGWSGTGTGRPATTPCVATPSTPTFSREWFGFPFVEVSGQGVYEIPVGPVHAGLIEPGHFRFSVVGETILQDVPASVLRAPRRREAVRGTPGRRRYRVGRADQRRHRSRPQPGLRDGRRGRAGHRGAGTRPAGAGAAAGV